MAESIQHRAAEELAAGYKWSHRIAELIAMGAYAVMATVLFYHVALAAPSHPLIFVLFAVGGYIAADFVSGMVHWFCDTWGSPDWFVVGPLFIRTFREHHVDPLSITRHDFVETNGANCMGVIPVLAPALLLNVDPNVGWRVGLGAFCAMFSLCIPFTSQAHKWAHMDVDKVPVVVRLLQRAGLLLSKVHHQEHHQAPFVKNYCITTGLCDHLLERVSFFRVLERLITRATGAIPREDDIGKEAAKAIAE
jgi:ubiquitin-conjugating enzyme E2 variant